MPRTAVAIQEITPQSSAAVALATVDAVNNNMFQNDGRTALLIQNPTGGALACTIVSVADQHNRTGDLVLSLAAGEIRQVGPLRQAIWNQFAADVGNVYVNPAAALKIAALRLNF
jgi:hypothetical protein